MTPHRLTQSRRAATVPTRVTHSPAPSIGGHRAGGIRPNRGRTATPPIARAPIRGLGARPKQASPPHGGPRARSRPTRYPQPAVRRSKSIPPPGPRTHKPAPPHAAGSHSFKLATDAGARLANRGKPEAHIYHGPNRSSGRGGTLFRRVEGVVLHRVARGWAPAQRNPAARLVSSDTGSPRRPGMRPHPPHATAQL